MPDTKISADPLASALGGTESLAGVQGGGNVRITPAQIRDFIAADATFIEALQDLTASFLGAGSNVSISYNDAGNSLSISSTDTTLTTEDVQDIVGAFIAAGSNVTVSYNDAANTFTVSASGGGSGDPVHMGYVTGRWYFPRPGVLTAGATLANGNFRFIEFVPTESFTISTVGLRISTAVGSTNFQIAVYAADATTKKPTSTPLATTANMSGGSVANVSAAFSGSATVSFVKGTRYWFGVCVDAAIAWSSYSTTQADHAHQHGGANQGALVVGSSQVAVGIGYTGTHGTWGDLTAQSWTDITANAAPAVHFAVASIP